jgi:GT2 family glycosyltransferase
MDLFKASVNVGAVAIGRNEGERLRACLRSLTSDVGIVAYVDSGSTDDSLAIAQELGVVPVELDNTTGFTAARARNTGFHRLMQLFPGLEFVQFIDGDSEIVEGWIAEAVDFLQKHAEVAVVYGRGRERHPHRNWYHRVADMEWDTPVGEATSCGGIALMRTCALRQTGGYRDTMIAGEEPELCVRLRNAGWKVWRLDREMTLHDIRMTSFSQWWKRTVRSGHAYAEGARLHGASPDRHCIKETRSIWFWGIAIPLLGVFFAWPTRGVSLLVMMAIYLVLFIKISRYRVAIRRNSWQDASLYALSCVVGKWPQAIGMLKSFFDPRNRLASDPR